MVTFEKCMTERQIRWRAKHLDIRENGHQNGREYSWILPYRYWEDSLWPGIRSGSTNSLPNYLLCNNIRKHGGVHNLKSSWMACANLYFPFRASEDGRALLSGFLQKYVPAKVQQVDEVELEYEGNGPLHPSCLLGELDGARGTGQTSPDIAFLVNGGRGIILTENKLVEHSFYRCSARTRTGSSGKLGNPDPRRCENVLGVLNDPDSQCHQVVWGRKYWERLLQVVNKEEMLALKCCPAARAGYQLFRQQALAEGFAASGKYDFVVSSVAMDERNETLANCLRSTGIADLANGWPKLFNGKAGFAVFTHQKWVEWVRQHDDAKKWGVSTHIRMLPKGGRSLI